MLMAPTDAARLCGNLAAAPSQTPDGVAEAYGSASGDEPLLVLRFRECVAGLMTERIAAQLRGWAPPEVAQLPRDGEAATSTPGGQAVTQLAYVCSVCPPTALPFSHVRPLPLHTRAWANEPMRALTPLLLQERGVRTLPGLDDAA